MRETLAAIKVIMDCTNCIYGVRDAMAREDYEAAAGFVGTFMEIEEGHAAGAAPDGPQAAEQAQVTSLLKFRFQGSGFSVTVEV